MTKGISLHIGLNSLNPKHYNNWSGDLTACEADAKDMAALAKKQKFASTILLTQKASSAAVISAISSAGKKLKPGDIFFLSYSGHGGQVPDTNGDEVEDDMDETWALYDRQLIDDELYALWGAFQSGVRIIMLSDSCHSGSVARLIPMYAGFPNAVDVAPPPGYRGIPTDVARRTYQANKDQYQAIQTSHPAGEKVAIGASVLLISGCQDHQLSSDGLMNGLFTATLKEVWKNGAFGGGYTPFYKAILRKMPPYQTPNLFKVGMPNMDFERQKPFTI
jgi:hypothetical protein